MKNVRGRRQIRPGIDRREHPTAIVIDFDKYMPDRRHGLAGPGPLLRRHRVHAYEHVETPGSHQAKPGLEVRLLEQFHWTHALDGFARVVTLQK